MEVQSKRRISVKAKQLVGQRGATHLADEGEGLPPHPLGTVAEPDGELVDEVQAQVVGAGRVELLKDLHHLIARGRRRVQRR